MRKLCCLMIIVTFINALLSGCWNYVETDRLLIIIGAAVDKSEDHNQYILTVESVKVESGGQSQRIESEVLESRGADFFAAVRNLTEIAGKKAYWAHMKAVIVSREIAEGGIGNVLDWLTRNEEPRIESHILISKEATAKEIFYQQGITQQLLSIKVDDTLKAQNDLCKTMPVENYQFLQALSEEGRSAVLPAIGVINAGSAKTFEISGLALFKKDKFIGFLNGEDTQYLLFARNEFKRGLLLINQDQTNKKPNVSLEVFTSKTRVKPVYMNGQVSFKLNVLTETALAEQPAFADFTSPGAQADLKRNAEEYLDSNIKAVIQKVQIEYDSDIFGFGEQLKKNKPSVWKKVKPDWDKIFKELSVEVESKVEIRSSETINKPIKRGG